MGALRKGRLVRAKLLGRPETVLGVYMGEDEVLCEHLGSTEPQVCENIRPDNSREGAEVWRRLFPIYVGYRRLIEDED